jgi:NAD(P)H-dependent FMN reductase
MTTHRVGYLIGSLAKGSINRKLAKALVRLAPPELEMSEISFKDLPLTAKQRFEMVTRRQRRNGSVR